MKEKNPDAVDLVIFGGTGDLALRKLLPALYAAFKEAELNNNNRIYVSCRTSEQAKNYLQNLRKSLQKYVSDKEFVETTWQQFSSLIVPVILDIAKPGDGWHLLQQELSAKTPRIFYFSIAPSLFASCCSQLSRFNLVNQYTRVVQEKPIGYNRDSAEHINTQVGKYFKESQIFRIDHYLGKETVQNLLVLRFSNLLFENMWDRQAVDNIQISINETVGLEGRAGFYDDVGALRDMVQNHLLQLLCLIAMEPPGQLNADSIRTEKIKVLTSLKPIEENDVKEFTVRGQYVTGETQNHFVPGYLEELKKSKSFCETFVAIKAHVDNWRWSGVPFYLRTGKRLKQRIAEIVVQFKPVSHSIYAQAPGKESANRLIIQLQPDEKIQLQLTSKNLGKTQTELTPVTLDLNLTDNTNNYYGDAYKRLLLDVFANDPSLFIHREEIEQAWTWIDPIIDGWKTSEYQPELYRAGSWGPDSANRLLQNDGRQWCEPMEQS